MGFIGAKISNKQEYEYIFDTIKLILEKYRFCRDLLSHFIVNHFANKTINRNSTTNDFISINNNLSDGDIFFKKIQPLIEFDPRFSARLFGGIKCKKNMQYNGNICGNMGDMIAASRNFKITICSSANFYIASFCLVRK